MKKLFKQTSVAICILASLTACNNENTSNKQQAQNNVVQVLTAKDADSFLIATEKELITLGIEGSRAEWIYSNFITDDTAALSAAANQKSTEAGVRFAMAAAKFDDVEVTKTQRRKLNTLKQSLVMPAPQDSKKSQSLPKLVQNLVVCMARELTQRMQVKR